MLRKGQAQKYIEPTTPKINNATNNNNNYYDYC